MPFNILFIYLYKAYVNEN